MAAATSAQSPRVAHDAAAAAHCTETVFLTLFCTKPISSGQGSFGAAGCAARTAAMQILLADFWWLRECEPTWKALLRTWSMVRYLRSSKPAMNSSRISLYCSLMSSQKSTLFLHLNKLWLVPALLPRLLHKVDTTIDLCLTIIVSLSHFLHVFDLELAHKACLKLRDGMQATDARIQYQVNKRIYTQITNTTIVNKHT